MQGSDISWDFGDGGSAKGDQVQHAYNTAGDRTVTVSVIGPNDLEAPEKTIDIRVVDLSMRVEPVTPPLVVGLPIRLKPRIEGPIERMEWEVDGVRYPPSENNELEFTFTESGKHTVVAVGFAQQTTIRSDTVPLSIEPPPKVVAETEILIGKPISFRVTAPKGYERIDWSFEDEETIRGGGEAQARTFRVLGKQTIRAEVVYPGDRKLDAK